MHQKGITQYTLIHQYHISPGQITRLNRNESVSTHTINMFCDLFRCWVEDVMVFIHTDEKNADSDNLCFLSDSGQLEEPRIKAAEDDKIYDKV